MHLNAVQAHLSGILFDIMPQAKSHLVDIEVQ